MLKKYIEDGKPRCFDLSDYLLRAKPDFIDGIQVSKLAEVYELINDALKPFSWTALCRKNKTRVMPSESIKAFLYAEDMV